MVQVNYLSEVFKEGDQYVGLSPHLNASSFGDTPEEARNSLQEAVEAFLEGCGDLGTLNIVFEESGFHKAGDIWRLGDRVSEERVAILS